MSCAPKNRSCGRRQNGIAVVEFAIGILVILLVLLVAAELGRAFFTYNTLTKSVRVGARYLSVNALDDGGRVDLDIGSATTKNLIIYGSLGGGTPQLPGLGPNDIAISAPTPSGAIFPYVRILATYPYVPIIGPFPSFGGNSFDFNFTMTAAATMRVIR